MNHLFVQLGIESWKPLLTALLLPPVPWLLLILVGAWWPSARRGPGRWVVLLGVVGHLGSAPAPGTARLLSHHLLQPPPALDSHRIAELQAERKTPTAIVVLGGGVEPHAPEYGASNLTETSLERLRYGIWLGRRTDLPLAFSGGVGWAQHDSVPEAQVAARIAASEFGRPLRWTEDSSRDTRENALRTIELLRPAGIRHIVLVTGATHMPRALRDFQRAGGAGHAHRGCTDEPDSRHRRRAADLAADLDRLDPGAGNRSRIAGAVGGCLTDWSIGRVRLHQLQQVAIFVAQHEGTTTDRQLLVSVLVIRSGGSEALGNGTEVVDGEGQPVRWIGRDRRPRFAAGGGWRAVGEKFEVRRGRIGRQQCHHLDHHTRYTVEPRLLRTLVGLAGIDPKTEYIPIEGDAAIGIPNTDRRMVDAEGRSGVTGIGGIGSIRVAANLPRADRRCPAERRSARAGAHRDRETCTRRPVQLLAATSRRGPVVVGIRRSPARRSVAARSSAAGMSPVTIAMCWNALLDTAAPCRSALVSSAESVDEKSSIDSVPSRSKTARTDTGTSALPAGSAILAGSDDTATKPSAST